MSVRLYIGNLPKELERKDLQDVFAEEGESVSAKVITDRKTGKCRGFGFVTVPNDEIADQIVEKYNGFMFRENALKIEKALPRKKGKTEGQDEEQQASQQQQQPQQQQQQQRSPSKGGSSGGGKNRKKSNRNSQSTAANNASDNAAIQPDPRWANELEKLKQMLAAQATNS